MSIDQGEVKLTWKPLQDLLIWINFVYIFILEERIYLFIIIIIIIYEFERLIRLEG